jgi:CheY-like chemotaxis protein
MGPVAGQSFAGVLGCANLRGATVLVVEDHAACREALVAFLDGQGMSVFSASCIRDALEVFERSRPGLIVSDLGLPDGDGCELIARVREIGGRDGCFVPAIALTAFLLSDVRSRALHAGFQACLAKSDINALVAQLSALSNGPNSSAAERT